MTFHYRGTCHRCHKIVCTVPTETHERADQPQIVVRGWANSVGMVEHEGDGDEPEVEVFVT